MIWLTCDRCNQDFQGLESVTATGTVIHIGFFRFYEESGKPTIWHKYARGIEEIVCRECMWQDDAYLAKSPWWADKKLQKLVRDGFRSGINATGR